MCAREREEKGRPRQEGMVILTLWTRKRHTIPGGKG